jgi:iron complex transport system substrate-binding protein
MRTAATLAAFAAGVVALVSDSLAGAGSNSKPQRIVSLNLCIDQILLDLVPRERIGGVSFLAADPSMSLVANEAQGLLTVRGSAEEILALDPDLVLAGEYTTAATVDLLRRLGQRVEVVPMATSFAQIRDVVLLMGQLTGEEQRAQTLMSDFDTRLAEVKARAVVRSQAPRPRAVAMQVNSLASGELRDTQSSGPPAACRSKHSSPIRRKSSCARTTRRISAPFSATIFAIPRFARWKPRGRASTFQ